MYGIAFFVVVKLPNLRHCLVNFIHGSFLSDVHLNRRYLILFFSTEDLQQITHTPLFLNPSDSAKPLLLSQPNATGFPCLSPADTVAILDGYYQAMAALPRGRGQLSFAHHSGALLAARVTLSRAVRSIRPLSHKVYHPVYGDLHKMRVRELRDALELKETAKDIILRRPTRR